jgi:hypothetical protein
LDCPVLDRFSLVDTAVMQEKKKWTDFMLLMTSSNFKRFDAIWSVANSTSSSRTRHVARHTSAL